MKAKLERMIEICEQIETFESRVSMDEHNVRFIYYPFPTLIEKAKMRIHRYEVYIEFLNEKLQKLKLEL